MIIQWLVQIATGFASWIATLFPAWTPPDFLVHLDQNLNPVLENLNGVGAWIDWTFILAVVAAVILTWIITLAIKLLRAIFSYVPLIGGSG